MLRATLAASLLLPALLAGCVLQDGGPGSSGDLVRLVALTLDPDVLDEANDPQDVLAGLADTTFSYTHRADAVDSDDVTVSYVDESGRQRDVPLSDFTSLATLGRGDRVDIDGVLLTSAIEVSHGGDTIASRGGPAQDWLRAGGYPLPFTVEGGRAVWDLSGGLDLDAGFDALQVDDEERCDGPECPGPTATSTVRFTDASVVGEADLQGRLHLDSIGSRREPALELGLDGAWTATALGQMHVVEESQDPERQRIDADFGFDLDARLSGDGRLVLRFDGDELVAIGRQGTLDATGELATWDEDHPRATPARQDLDEASSSAAYDEQAFPRGGNPSQPIAQALADLWRMDLASGDEFRFDSGDRFGEGTPRASLVVRVVDQARKEVPAGTFDAWRIESSTAIVVPYDGGEQAFELPVLTTWIDVDSGVPVAMEQSFDYDYDLGDLRSLFALADDEGYDVTAPTQLHARLQGAPVAELAEWDEGLRMAPMVSVLLPLASVGAPLFAFLFPFGYGLGGFDTMDEAEPYEPMRDVAFSPDETRDRVTVVTASSGMLYDEFTLTASRDVKVAFNSNAGLLAGDTAGPGGRPLGPSGLPVQGGDYLDLCSPLPSAQPVQLSITDDWWGVVVFETTLTTVAACT